MASDFRLKEQLPRLIGRHRQRAAAAAEPPLEGFGGEVGKVGVPVGHIGDMQTLFEGIPLDRMNTSMTINATGAGLLSLSRCYTVPTQLIPALGTAYLVVASRRGRAFLPRFDAPTLLRVGALAGAFLIATLIFVRLMWREGSP